MIVGKMKQLTTFIVYFFIRGALFAGSLGQIEGVYVGCFFGITYLQI
jgi:hypothetical protein